MNLLNPLRNIDGEVELGRVLLATGGLAAIIAPIVFQWWDMWRNGAHFDVAAWCVAYPTGLGALTGIGVFSIGNKEKSIAAARQMQAPQTPPKGDTNGQL